MTASRVACEVSVPVAPAVVLVEPTNICCEAAWVICQPVAVLIPVMAMMSPTALVVGSAMASVPALLAMVPVLTDRFPFTVTTDHVSPNPPAVGVDHVPSPRQNVLEEALVPLFRLLTDRLPVTPLARLTWSHAGPFEVPVLARYLVAVVLLASLERVFAAEAYNMSPCA